MRFDQEKLKAVILYVRERCKGASLGAVTLHKVLYLADMLHYAHVGTPMMAATYRRRSHGPACDELPLLLRHLERNGSDETARIEGLGPAAIALLDEIIDFVCLTDTTRTISKYRLDRAWQNAEHGQVLSYNSAFQIFSVQVFPETMKAVLAEVGELEETRAGGTALGGNVLGVLREGILQTRKSH